MKKKLEALYQSLGSEANLRRIMGVFYARMAEDPMIGFFFSGKDLDLIADKQAEFLLRAMGARGFYTGKPPAQAHKQLPPILPGHFDRRLVILKATLQSEGLGHEEISTWIEFESTFRDSVVTPA